MTEIEVNNIGVREISARPASSRAGRLDVGVARLFERCIFGGLLLLTVLVAIPYGTVEPWWEALFEAIVFGLGALWLIDGLIRGVWHVQGRSLLIPLLLLTGFAFLQALPIWNVDGVKQALSTDAYATRLFVIKMLSLLMAGALLMRFTSSRRRLRWLIFVVIGVGVASALFGIIRQATQQSPGFGLPYLGLYERDYGQFINRNHFAFLMEMALGLALGFLVGGGARRQHVLLYLAAALPVWTALVLSNSRGGILSMLGQLIFIALGWTMMRPAQEAYRQQQKGISAWVSRIRGLLLTRVLLVGCLVGAVGIGVIWIGGEQLVNRLEYVSGEIKETGEEWREGTRRAQVWGATWKLIKANPIFGTGFGGYRSAISEFHNATGRKRPHEAHNDYLEIVSNGGVIGAAFGVWFVLAFIKRVRQTLRSPDRFRRAACFGALAGLFGVALHSFVDFGLHITINALICILLITIATINLTEIKRGNKSKDSSGEA